MEAAFVIFGPDHLITLMLVAVVSGLAFRAGQSRWAPSLNTGGGVLFAVMAVVLWLLKLGDGFQVNNDLPLWLCDIAFLLCLACFFKPNELILTLVVYWGLAGTLQAMITPDIVLAFPSREFLLFFVGHAIIVIGIFFLVGKSQPSRLPTPYGVGVAFLGLLGYTVSVGALDALFGWNYGYLRSKPLGASVLDQFGPWPNYVLGALIFALILFFAVAGLLRLLWNLFPGGDRKR